MPAKLPPNGAYLQDDGSVRIVLNNGMGAVIDAEDYPLVKNHRWYAYRNNKSWYPRTNIGGRKNHRVVFMHTLLVGIAPDHADGNGLNNRRKNLRSANKSQNAFNQKREKLGQSGVRGVTRDKRRGKWIAQIGVDNKNKFLGYFDTIEEAAEARLAGEEKYYPDFKRKA